MINSRGGKDGAGLEKETFRIDCWFMEKLRIAACFASYIIDAGLYERE